MLLHGSLHTAISMLQGIRTSCENLYGQMSGPYADPRGAYLDWANSTYEHLRGQFADIELAEQVFSKRYWSIAESGIADRVAQSVTVEIKAQSDRLRTLQGLLERYRSVGDRPGHPTVLDTNVLIQFLRMDQVPWASIVGDKVVRLIIPTIVLDEIDQKRYSDSRRTRERARRATDPLDERQHELEVQGYAAIAHGVSVEYFIEPTPRRLGSNADQDILDAAEFFAAAANRSVSLVTADRGFRVRAVARSGLVHPILMPMDYSKDRMEDGAEELHEDSVS